MGKDARNIKDLNPILSHIEKQNLSLRATLQTRMGNKQALRTDGDNTSLDSSLNLMIALCGQALEYNSLLPFKRPNVFQEGVSRFQEIITTIKNRLTQMLKEKNLSNLKADTTLIENLTKALRKEYIELK